MLDKNKSYNVPFAKDGTWFSPKCGTSKSFTVGEKKDKKHFNNFYDALEYLQNMKPTAKWRRPNSKGHPGIVSAVGWKIMSYDELIKDWGVDSEILNQTLANKDTSKEVAFTSEETKIDNQEMDTYVIDGRAYEAKILLRSRNQKRSKERKELDNYSCQICGFNYNNKIVESHHLNPLSLTEETIVKLDDLITLCPNCHAIAHDLLRQNTSYINRDNLIVSIKSINNKTIYFNKLK